MYKPSVDYAAIIRNLRKANGKTQAELAKEIGCGKTTICNYETGYSVPSLITLERIAYAFGISLGQLLSDNTSTAAGSSASFPRVPQTVNDTSIAYFNSVAVPEEAMLCDRYADSILTLPGFMLTESENCFCIKIQDNSMANDGIRKNDFAFVHKTDNIPNKSIVFALNTQDNRYIIRRYWRDGHIITLLPASDGEEFPVIRYDERNPGYRIMGYVCQVLVKVSRC